MQIFGKALTDEEMIEITGFYQKINHDYENCLQQCSWTFLVKAKVLMQGKLIAVVYTLRKYWNQFSLGGICKQE